MADGDGLENHCGGNVTVGSNPTPSAPRPPLHALRSTPSAERVKRPASRLPASLVLGLPRPVPLLQCARSAAKARESVPVLEGSPFSFRTGIPGMAACIAAGSVFQEVSAE